MTSHDFEALQRFELHVQTNPTGGSSVLFNYLRHSDPQGFKRSLLHRWSWPCPWILRMKNPFSEIPPRCERPKKAAPDPPFNNTQIRTEVLQHVAALLNMPQVRTPICFEHQEAHDW